MLLQLAALESVDFSGMAVDAPQRYEALIAAARTAFAAGDASVADPDVVGFDAGAKCLQHVLRGLPERAGRAPVNQGGTAVATIVDSEGNAAALVQSVFLAFGAGVADPSTGVLLNNRMIGFTTQQGHPNRLAPGKRPAHTLNPVLTLERGEIRHALATPGGPGQTLTLTQVLQAAVDHRRPLGDALALPRWSMDLAGAAIVEPELAEATYQALQHIPVDRGAKGSPYFGSAECVERLPDGGVLAVADDRREGHAIAI